MSADYTARAIARSKQCSEGSEKGTVVGTR